MNLRQAFKIAIKSIAAKKGRSALTMLGIIIGLSAVIILVSFANQAWKYDGTDVSEKLYSYCQTLDEYVKGVTPVGNYWRSLKVTYGAKTLSDMNTDWESMPQLYFGNQQYGLCMGYTIAKGRDLTYIDIENLNHVCVIGSKTASVLFNYADPIGETIVINEVPMTVVGVYAETDPNNYSGKDLVILAPYTVARDFGRVEIEQYQMVAKDAASAPMAVTLVKGYLKGLIGDNGYYYVQNESQWIDQSNEQNLMQQMFLGGIAAISLLVGGIGIMNIMLVTVTERTREIGIRKAIGAERKSIIAQFLIEACLICGIGGIIGIAIGYLGTAIVCQLVLKFISWPSMTVTLGSFAFSVAMGVIFGLYPAVKASGLQPVEALRAD